VLFTHGNKDTLVSFDQGKKLFLGHTSENKYFIENHTGDHYNFFRNGVVTDLVQEFLREKKISNTYNFITPEHHAEWQKLNDVYRLDTQSDDSLVKFVNPDVAFLDPGYIPANLQDLESPAIIDSKGNSQLDSVAAKQFIKMAEQFYEDTREKMVVVSSYRSYNYQAGIKARGCPDSLCAKAGHSEHQS